jgi:ATP-binding cassette, subfamily C (CFTR/MRP), member 1
MLPMALSFLAPTMVALKRVGTFLTAEELSHPYLVDGSEERKEAIVVDGDFTWEAVKGEEAEQEEETDPMRKRIKEMEKKEREKEERKRKRKEEKEAKKKRKEGKEDVLPTTVEEKKEENKDEKPKEEPFVLKGLKMSVPKGAFVGIIGRVGSGKVSLISSFCFAPAEIRVV